MTASEPTVAASAADRGSLTAAPHINPIAALAAALIGPLVGLFRKRLPAIATEERTSVETYRSRTVRDSALRPRRECRRTAAGPASQKGGRSHG